MRRISGKPLESTPVHREVNNHNARPVAAIKLIAGLRVARFEHACNAGRLQHAFASL